MSQESGDLFQSNAVTESVPSRRIRWKATHRLIPTRYPPISIFERVAPPEDFDLLYKLEDLTNPRLREEAGDISLVPASKRVTGEGASLVMAPFTHVSKDRQTRFSDGTYGVYYAGHEFETALREVAFHVGRFFGKTADPAHSEDYRALQGSIDKKLHDIRRGSWAHLLDPSVGSYPAPQAFAKALRGAGSNGIAFPSVRHPGGECIAAFWPNVISIPIQAKHIKFQWDGERISSWFDYESDTWNDLD